MSKLKKHTEIPTDWSCFSDNKVRENIDYLAKHFMEYKLRRADKNAVRIGDVVIEQYVNLARQKYFLVNNAFVRDNKTLTDLYTKVDNILNMQKSETFKAKDIAAIAGFGMLFIFGISGVLGGGKSVAKDKQQNVAKTQQKAQQKTSQIAKDTCFVKTR